MESQPQNPEFRNNPENIHPCLTQKGNPLLNFVVSEIIFIDSFNI